MGIASGLVSHVVRRVDQGSVRAALTVLLVLAAAVAGGVLIADHLQPASEPLITAPLRWIG
jgi:hypothetical protein